MVYALSKVSFKRDTLEHTPVFESAGETKLKMEEEFVYCPSHSTGNLTEQSLVLNSMESSDMAEDFILNDLKMFLYSE